MADNSNRSRGMMRLAIVSAAVWYPFWAYQIYSAHKSKLHHEQMLDRWSTGQIEADPGTAEHLSGVSLDIVLASEQRINIAIACLVAPIVIAAVVLAARWVMRGFKD